MQAGAEARAAVLSFVLFQALLPAVIAGLVLLIGQRPWRETEQGALARMAAGFGLAVGYAVGYSGILRPTLAPTDITHWLFYLVLLAGAASVVESFVPERVWLRLATRVVVALGASFLLVRPLLAVTTRQGVALVWFAGFAVSIVAIWTSIFRVGTTHRTAISPLALIVLSSAGAVTLVMGGTAVTGQLLGLVAAGLGGVFVLALRFGDRLDLRSVAPVFAVALVGHGAVGVLYAELPRASLFLLLATPLLLSITLLAPFFRLRFPALLISWLLLAAVPSGLAAALAAQRYFGLQSSTGDPKSPGAKPGGDKAGAGTDDDYGY
jgi:hypothetical protein